MGARCSVLVSLGQCFQITRSPPPICLGMHLKALNNIKPRQNWIYVKCVKIGEI